MFDLVGNGAFAEIGAGVFPPLNISQDADNVYVRAEIPGVDAKALEVSALGRRLSISGKREIAVESDRASYHRRERAEGEFSRTVTLPTEIDVGRVDAKYSAGILTLALPKTDAAKPRQIAVKA
jgi:HSP20 family protein